MSGECPICEKHRGRGPLVGERVWEDEHVLAYHARRDTVDGYLGYLFVETRRHVPSLASLTDDEAHALATARSRLARALEAAGAEHVYSFVFDHLPHHHEHVVARHPGAPEEFRGVRVTDWPDAPRGDDDAVVAYCERLRKLLG